MVKPYVVLAGCNYPPHGKGSTEKRAEPGDIVSDLPPKSIADLLAQGVIREPEDGEPVGA